jgi:hypothetical protein
VRAGLTKRQREVLTYCLEDGRIAWGAPLSGWSTRPSGMGGANRRMIGRMQDIGLLDDAGHITEAGRRALAEKEKQP